MNQEAIRKTRGPTLRKWPGPSLPPAQRWFGRPSLLDLVHHLNWHRGDKADLTPRDRDNDGQWDYILQTWRDGGPIEGSAYKLEYGEELIEQVCAEAGIDRIGSGEFRCSRIAIEKSNLVQKILPTEEGMAIWRATVTCHGEDTPRQLVLEVFPANR